MIGQNLGNYKIIQKIGAGGQGTVYKATDQKLGRTVVVKVLPAELTVKEANLKRFEREARLADILRRELDGIRAILGDATDLERQLTRFGVGQFSAVISSLPIKWFPRDAQLAVLRPCFARLGLDGRFLQLTNAFSSPLPIEQLGLHGREAARVWRNLPPAQIWSYTVGSGGLARRVP